MVEMTQLKSSVRPISGLIAILLGIGTLYSALGSLPFLSEPMIACEMNPAGRPKLNADWTIEYYNQCHAHDGAYPLLAVLTIIGVVLITNGYLLLSKEAPLTEAD